jgi:signal transduction histidine kinase
VSLPSTPNDSADRAQSGVHPAPVPPEIPSAWLDRLLSAVCDAPVRDGEDAVVSALMRIISEVLPDMGVGARYASTTDDGEVVVRITKLTPRGQEGRGAGTAPDGLFPGYAHERQFPIAGFPGTTFHVAADVAEILAEHGVVDLFAKRVSQAMTRSLVATRECSAMKRTALELQLVTENLAQAQKLASLGQLAAGIVHELNNPLTSIVAYSSYLEGRLHDTDDLARLGRIRNAAERMVRFTRDLMTYARPAREELTVVDLHAVIERALSHCEHILATSEMTVERRFAAELPQVMGRPDQLEQVFVNLFTNACHAVLTSKDDADKGLLLVSTSFGAKHVRILVEDNGPGIDPGNTERVFVPFFTTKDQGSGTGLGLSIVKNIIDVHGGSVGAKPVDMPGRGTRFFVELPASAH